MRVATVLPSATEIVYALGMETVAVSHECDYPVAARTKPAITRSKIDDSGDSTSINESVQQVLQSENGVYDIDLEVFDETHPTVAITQGICDVCAVDEVTIERAIEAVPFDVSVLTTDPHRLADVFDDILRIGEALDRSAAATAFVADLRERVQTTTRGASDTGVRTVVLDWMAPPMVAGHWVPELIEWAGGEYGLASTAERSRPREWSEILAYDPEVLIVAPCGFPVEKTRDQLDELRRQSGWAGLSAVERGQVYVVDGNQLVNRPGPRLVETLQVFTTILSDRSESEYPSTWVRRIPRRTRPEASR